MARHDASELAHRLARDAEAVCRRYLSAGRREGGYWLVGDVRNTPGRSMFVRLKESPKGPAGKWTDAATGEHGDLLDVIRESCGLVDFKDVADEARSFLSLPHPEPEPDRPRSRTPSAPTGSPEAARRLFAMSQPIERTLVDPTAKEHVWSALTSLASSPVQERTITGLAVLLQSTALKQALQPYCVGGASGRLLDAETEQLGSARVQAKNWRLMAFGSLALLMGLACGLVWQSTHGSIVPWVVQVDKLGQAQAVSPATADYTPSDPEIAWYLARFIELVRSLPADPIIVRQNWLDAYDFTSTSGSQALNDYARANDPFAKLGHQQIAVDISSVIRASGIRQGEMPPLFVIGPAGGSELVNYRVRDNYYIVDRLFGAAELRLGDKDSERRVRIVRTDGRPRS